MQNSRIHVPIIFIVWKTILALVLVHFFPDFLEVLSCFVDSLENIKKKELRLFQVKFLRVFSLHKHGKVLQLFDPFFNFFLYFFSEDLMSNLIHLFWLFTFFFNIQIIPFFGELNWGYSRKLAAFRFFVEWLRLSLFFNWVKVNIFFKVKSSRRRALVDSFVANISVHLQRRMIKFENIWLKMMLRWWSINDFEVWLWIIDNMLFEVFEVCHGSMKVLISLGLHVNNLFLTQPVMSIKFIRQTSYFF